MRRGRSGIGTELVPLVLILASLAGSVGLVIAIHRRFVARTSAEKAAVAIVAPPLPAPILPRPISTSPAVAPDPEVDEPEPPPPPPPEDVTAKEVAKLMSAEAEQLLEASKADRKANELEAARKAAVAESERWRRRESLVRQQVDSLETKVHQLETHADELALERDALEKEIDARKALAAEARSRPSTAILPHRGQNGTWRRPIVIECVNGMAIIRPQNLGFGLLELSMGFGPSTNPFVATVAREAIRIQGNASPDGERVTPYIFFLVRPDGIRTYYEARGRLESLGITFGYELADQDWEIDFPDLDDVKTWDGSSPLRSQDAVARLAQSRQTSPSPPEFEILPDLTTGPGSGNAQGQFNNPQSEFTWPPRPRSVPTGGGGRVTLGGTGAGVGTGGIGNSYGSRAQGAPGLGGGQGASPSSGNGGVTFPGGTAGANTSNPGIGSGFDEVPPLAAPRELKLGGPITPLPPAGGGRQGTPGFPANPTMTGTSGSSLAGPSSPGAAPTDPDNRLGQGPNEVTIADSAYPPQVLAGGNAPSSLPPVVSPRNPPAGMNSGMFASTPVTGAASPGSGSAGEPTDPANTYVFPSPSSLDASVANQASGSVPASPTPVSPSQTPPVRHIGPFSRPLATGIDPALLADASGVPASVGSPANTDPTQPDSLNPSPANSGVNPEQSSTSANTGVSSNASRKPGTVGAPPSTVIGPGDQSSPAQDPGSPPPPLSVGLGSPASVPSGTPPPLPFGSPSTMTPPPAPTSNPPKATRPKPSPSPSDRFKIYDKRYEIVIVCNAKGVIVQPGSYRVTSDALKKREGLLKTQIVSLVKAKRAAEPKQSIEPAIRFLVQPGGEATFWAAKSQFLLMGLDWPITTQVADRDHLSVIPSESW